MRKSLRFSAAFFAAFVFSLTTLFAQTVTVSGSVKNAVTQEGIPAVSVTVKGGSQGTFTDAGGHFKLNVSQLPITLVFSSVGYETKELPIDKSSETVDVVLNPVSSLGQEVVVSATRTPQRILESPVSIERVSSVDIRNAPATSYYDIITNLKGVDVVTSSLTFRTPTTRGFASSGNTRFNQLVDGMDNQSPGLNFSVGTIIGLSELDVDNMELLPGASSALYGPGGMNGTLLINSKNPFKYQGLSYQVKTGIMHISDNDRGVSPYYNWALRWGKKVSERLAFKINTELIQAKDWLAQDYRNYKRLGSTGAIAPGTRETDPNYDGINVYGDETSVNLKDLLNGLAPQVPFLAGYISTLPGSILVSRTGYKENEVANPNTLNFKFSGALHYKLTSQIEAILAGNWGTGSTVYTGSDRYSLKDFKMGQYKLELNSKNWFVRGYTTQENAGESHNLTVTTQLFNEAWKPTVTRDANGNPTPQPGDWLVQYALAYINAKQAGRPDIEAHNIARSVADLGRPLAGSQQFKSIFDAVRTKPIPQGGLFIDRSDLWMVEGQYNLSDKVKFAEVLVGGNWKQYVLNSEGTLFADEVGKPIRIDEFGAYAQVGRDIVKDLLKVTVSGRYDKNENFEGRFTPRVTAVIKPAKDQNVRLSFQTAYRFPSTQQQWIDLNVGSGTLIGSSKSLWEKYDLLENPGYNPQTVPPFGTSLEKVPYQQVKPESVTSFEAGYKALIQKKLLVDVYGYYGSYKNFITRRDVIQFPGGVPGAFSSGKGFSIVANSPEKVKTYGWGASAEYLFPNNFVVSGNISSDKIKDVPSGFRAFFNAPDIRTVLSVANTGFGPNKLLGFNVAWRWQEGFFYENDFAQGDLPGFHVVDASVSLKAPKIKSLFKLGATNIGNQYYQTAIGNPSVGGLYYVSFAYNVL